MEKIIFIGLGNPDSQYKKTRHNIGKDFLIWKAECENHIVREEKSFKYFSFQEHNKEVFCVMPILYMNNSGFIFNETYFKDILKEKNKNTIIIIHDDLQVDFGKFKLRINNERGDRGHNGNRSINSHLKLIQGSHYTKPYYLSIGIGRPDQESVEKWVLKKFNFQELTKIENLFPSINMLLKTQINSIAI